MKKTEQSDTNFDKLALKFQRKVYGGLKGEIRLAVLRKDLSEFGNKFLQPAEGLPARVLDAGGGYGPFSLKLAKLGHHLVLCDISRKMLEKAKADCEAKQISGQVEFLNCAIQDLGEDLIKQYDLVLCHAVLEWLEKPEQVLNRLLSYIKPEGLLSLTFYNLNGTIFKNLLRINYNKIIENDYAGWPGSLTPPNPLLPENVLSWLEERNFEIICHSGMRVFHDYILDLEDKDKHPETVLDLELKLSRKMPFRDLGRYQHILAKQLYTTA